MERLFAFLHDRGYQVADVEGLKEKHIALYFEARKAEGKEVRTLQNEASHIRGAMRAVGRAQAAESPTISNDALEISGSSRDGTRVAATEEEYQAALEIAAGVDEGLVAVFKLQRTLGLRGAESVQAGRSLATWERQLAAGGRVTVLWGTKGGRRRESRAPDMEKALEAVREALAVAAKRGGRIIDRPRLKAAMTWYRNTVHRHVTDPLDLQAHALRYPQWELGVQVFAEEDADRYSFDVLDATKIVPEEIVPVQPLGRLVLNRNPDNFFAETEQVAFCAAHVIPGIDFTNDPLLAGRIHSYVDTQISRLGGPNFHEIPVNAPLAPVHNNQREGMHRQAIHRGRVAYEPNSLGSGCPYQAGSAGFVSFPEPVLEDEVRGKPEKFAEHFNQAALFFDSQAPSEQAHLAAAFRFELSKVTVPAVRQRVVSMLRNVSEALAAQVAQGLGMELPNAMPRALAKPPKAEVSVSKSLSMLARPGTGGIETRKVAILVADGVDADQVAQVQAALLHNGAVGRLVGPRIGPFTAADGSVVDADASLENEPSVLFDGVMVPAGKNASQAWARDGRAGEFIKDQFRHCKTIIALGEAVAFVEGTGVLRDPTDTGLILQGDPSEGWAEEFIAALSAHRHFARESDPPPI